MGVRVPPFAPCCVISRLRPGFRLRALLLRSFAALRMNARGSNAVHARSLRIWRGNPWGFESPLRTISPTHSRIISLPFRRARKRARGSLLLVATLPKLGRLVLASFGLRVASAKSDSLTML